jgi:hypothetical protein
MAPAGQSSSAGSPMSSTDSKMETNTAPGMAPGGGAPSQDSKNNGM